ncbi:hypothetical protein Dimus_008000 [Dionaea muscipula]
MFHYKKKEVARLRVRGVEIVFDSMRLASILGVPGNTGICEYIKEVWEESKYIKPLEITKKFANDDMIMTARRVGSAEMKPFQRFVHFFVMKNVAHRFGKRVMMRHMSYVISVKDHELPYGDWMTMVLEAFDVPLIEKKGEEPKRYDFFEETFLTMYQLKRENGIWWLGSGENKRRDDDEDASAENEEVNVIVQDQTAPATVATSPADSSTMQKEKITEGVDPSGPTGNIPDYVVLKLQAELEQARARRLQADLDKAQVENARILALLQQAQSQPKP